MAEVYAQNLIFNFHQFSYLPSSNECQDRGLPPGTEHIYLNSEAVKKIYHNLYGVCNSLLHIWPKNTTGRFLNTFTTISSGFQRNLPLKVRSFAVGGQIQERQKREVPCQLNYVYKKTIKRFEGVRRIEV